MQDMRAHLEKLAGRGRRVRNDPTSRPILRSASCSTALPGTSRFWLARLSGRSPRLGNLDEEAPAQQTRQASQSRAMSRQV